MRLSPDVDGLQRQVDAYSQRLRHDARRALATAADCIHEISRHLRAAARSRVHAEATRLERAAGGIERHRPANLYARRELALQTLASRLEAAMASRLAAAAVERTASALPRAASALLSRAGSTIESDERALELVGPASVLRRGYSATLRSDGAAVRSAAEVAPGDVLRTIVADGSFESTVGTAGSRALPPSLGPIAAPPRPRPRKRPHGAPGPSLFE
jgi:exonuclease VII large subunit